MSEIACMHGAADNNAAAGFSAICEEERGGGGPDCHSLAMKSAGGGSTASKICLGSTSGAPNTILAADTPVSLVGAALNPIRTQGRCRGQSDQARQARSASFSRRWHLSTIPFAWGWKAVVGWCWMPSCSHRASQMAEVNCVPRSEVSCAGTPYLEIQPALRMSAQVAAAITHGRCL
jgi:hypothetical protein